jgi:hypothetical protein
MSLTRDFAILNHHVIIRAFQGGAVTKNIEYKALLLSASVDTYYPTNRPKLYIDIAKSYHPHDPVSTFDIIVLYIALIDHIKSIMNMTSQTTGVVDIQSYKQKCDLAKSLFNQYEKGIDDCLQDIVTNKQSKLMLIKALEMKAVFAMMAMDIASKRTASDDSLIEYHNLACEYHNKIKTDELKPVYASIGHTQPSYETAKERSKMATLRLKQINNEVTRLEADSKKKKRKQPMLSKHTTSPNNEQLVDNEIIDPNNVKISSFESNLEEIGKNLQKLDLSKEEQVSFIGNCITRFEGKYRTLMKSIEPKHDITKNPLLVDLDFRGVFHELLHKTNSKLIQQEMRMNVLPEIIKYKINSTKDANECSS